MISCLPAVPTLNSLTPSSSLLYNSGLTVTVSGTTLPALNAQCRFTHTSSNTVTASGTYVATGSGQMVCPIGALNLGTYTVAISYDSGTNWVTASTSFTVNGTLLLGFPAFVCRYSLCCL